MRTVSTNKKRKFHIKAGDTVYVTAGKEKGKTGKVLRISAKDNKAVVEKLNMVKRHTQSTQKNPTGGIIEQEAGIDVSNLMLYDSSVSSPTRVGYKVNDNGEKTRISKKSGKEI